MPSLAEKLHCKTLITQCMKEKATKPTDVLIPLFTKQMHHFREQSNTIVYSNSLEIPVDKEKEGQVVTTAKFL